jgi:hypothetical protein
VIGMGKRKGKEERNIMVPKVSKKSKGQSLGEIRKEVIEKMVVEAFRAFVKSYIGGLVDGGCQLIDEYHPEYTEEEKKEALYDNMMKIIVTHYVKKQKKE